MLPTLLPDLSRLRLDLLRVDGATIIVLMAATPSNSACFRRGHRYGTTLLDMERHCFIDLLPERKSVSLSLHGCITGAEAQEAAWKARPRAGGVPGYPWFIESAGGPGSSGEISYVAVTIGEG